MNDTMKMTESEANVNLKSRSEYQPDGNVCLAEGDVGDYEQNEEERYDLRHECECQHDAT